MARSDRMAGDGGCLRARSEPRGLVGGISLVILAFAGAGAEHAELAGETVDLGMLAL